MSVLTIYWVVTFNRTTSQANGINVWLAAFLSLGLVLAGVLSDWAKVRKPFMLVGAICAWDRTEAHAAARKHAAVAEFIRRRPYPGYPLQGPAQMPAAWDEFAGDEEEHGDG